MIPSSYEPVQPRPDWYQALEAGVPGFTTLFLRSENLQKIK